MIRTYLLDHAGNLNQRKPSTPHTVIINQHLLSLQATLAGMMRYIQLTCTNLSSSWQVATSIYSAACTCVLRGTLQ